MRAALPAAPVLRDAAPAPKPPKPAAPVVVENLRSEDYYRTKSLIFGALIEAIDLTQLARLDAETARRRSATSSRRSSGSRTSSCRSPSRRSCSTTSANDVLGYGPLEPLLARDDIADIMVNGANRTFIEVDGKIQLTNVRFRDNQQLMNICQRIVSQVGRRVDDASPICDARLPDGSRVNVIAPPLAIDGRRSRSASSRRTSSPWSSWCASGRSPPRVPRS